jgi:hypothetical protein
VLSSIPGDLWKLRPTTLDRRGLIAVLGAGRDIFGALLGNPAKTLLVRTK